MEVFRFGFRYWKRNLGLATLTQILSFIALTADLMIPMLSEMFIDYVIGEQQPEKGHIFSFLLSGKYGEVHTMRLFYHLTIALLTILLFRIILIYIKNVTNQKLGLRLETDLRMLTFEQLMKLDSETISEYNTGELLTTMNFDCIMFKEMFCRMMPNILDSLFALIISIVLLATINPWLLLIPVLLAPFFAVSLRRFKKMARINYKKIRGNNSKMNLTVQENIEAVRLVRSFTNEPLEEQKFEEANEELKKSNIDQILLSSKFEVVFSSIKQGAYIGSIIISALLVIRGDIMVGYLVACSSYVLKIMDYITRINNSIFQMQQQLVSGQKMMRFMNEDSKIKDGSQIANQKENPNLTLKNVSLVMEGKEILKGIDLDVPYGKKVGIVGGTGSGKSVLLESLIRIHDVTGGEILINGKDIRDYTLASLRNYFSYVFQDVFLFSNTIDSNIAYSEPEVEKEQIVEAAKHAQAHGFIMNLADQYDTIVGERGIGISGGQKQRVSIARALLKNAPILVLDDSTSALDVKTEKQLLEDIKVRYPDKTILISAHRLSSVVDCDEILYLQDGVILERGDFHTLMKLDGHFAKVYRIQEAQEKEVVDFDALRESEAKVNG